jgi:hypothetical protein
VPDGRLTPRQTDRLTVGRKLTPTSRNRLPHSITDKACQDTTSMTLVSKNLGDSCRQGKWCQTRTDSHCRNRCRLPSLSEPVSAPFTVVALTSDAFPVSFENDLHTRRIRQHVTDGHGTVKRSAAETRTVVVSELQHRNGRRMLQNIRTYKC